MAVDAYTFVGMYAHALDSAAHILAKGRAYASAKGVSDSELLGWRLIEDMHPLSFQLKTLCNFAGQWPARVAGLAVPEDLSPDLDVAGLQDAITKAKTYLTGLTLEQFEGRGELALTHSLGTGMEMTLPGGRWLAIFATTNVYFHLSTAYDILRARGVELGKRDLFAGGL